MMNLIEGMNIEIERAKDLLELYKSIPTGTFGAIVISQTIDQAENTMQIGDTIGMIRSYKELQQLA